MLVDDITGGGRGDDEDCVRDRDGPGVEEAIDMLAGKELAGDLGSMGGGVCIRD